MRLPASAVYCAQYSAVPVHARLHRLDELRTLKQMVFLPQPSLFIMLLTFVVRGQGKRIKRAVCMHSQALGLSS